MKFFFLNWKFNPKNAYQAMILGCAAGTPSPQFFAQERAFGYSDEYFYALKL